MIKNIDGPKAYVLDTSSIIGGYVSRDSPNFITNHVFEEVKDFKSRIFLESSLKEEIINIKEPDPISLKRVRRAMNTSGDVLRLSDVDMEVAALAITLKDDYKSVIVVTDDYSLQNVLKELGISYRSIITKGIEETYKWLLVCKGCKKRYPADHKENDCEICGSRLSRRRIKDK
jgi:UPF0271 protein